MGMWTLDTPNWTKMTEQEREEYEAAREDHYEREQEYRRENPREYEDDQ